MHKTVSGYETEIAARRCLRTNRHHRRTPNVLQRYGWGSSAVPRCNRCTQPNHRTRSAESQHRKEPRRACDAGSHGSISGDRTNRADASSRIWFVWVRNDAALTSKSSAAASCSMAIISNSKSARLAPGSNTGARRYAASSCHCNRSSVSQARPNPAVERTTPGYRACRSPLR